jgi:DNA-binding NarL/FixJ family response regulator
MSNGLSEFATPIRRIGRGGSVVDPLVERQLVRRLHGRGILETLSEREVLALMAAEGRSNHAIGDRLYVSDKTVETHVRNIFARLELTDTADDHRQVLAVLTYVRSTS